MTLKIADRWFDRHRFDDDITLLWEPHVTPWLRCNIWHVRGRDKHLFIDTGFGHASLKEATRDLVDKPVSAIATHSHYDHIGGHHEFEDCLIHPAELDALRNPEKDLLGFRGTVTPAIRKQLADNGYEIPEGLDIVDALPYEGFDPESFKIKPAPQVKPLNGGTRLDLGDRTFEVLHLPGHSPGSIGLWEAKTGILFSGDCIYDGQLLTSLPGADLQSYINSMHTLRDLPVTVVHGGHDKSFGRDRLLKLIDAFLAQWENTDA
ncbi:MAG: MBL fold metallo-hydrolase [Kiloniellales bacterium]|nr:MBL fold metallo-hydrolase [Kiloniellales bacterium]